MQTLKPWQRNFVKLNLQHKSKKLDAKPYCLYMCVFLFILNNIASPFPILLNSLD